MPPERAWSLSSGEARNGLGRADLGANQSLDLCWELPYRCVPRLLNPSHGLRGERSGQVEKVFWCHVLFHPELL